MKTLEQLTVEIFADGADLQAMIELHANPYIRGFTTNPTLMRRSGIVDYERFARDILERITDRPISFEVFSDEFDEMYLQARRISAWGKNVYVKIPITNTRGKSSGQLIRRLVSEGIHLNITALMTPKQVQMVSPALGSEVDCFISMFAGRIADTGREPAPWIREALDIMAPCPNQRLIWASPRELLNIFHADTVGCHVITLTHEILRKLPLLGMDLDALSLETVHMFHSDALGAGFHF